MKPTYLSDAAYSVGHKRVYRNL